MANEKLHIRYEDAYMNVFRIQTCPPRFQTICHVSRSLSLFPFLALFTATNGAEACEELRLVGIFRHCRSSLCLFAIQSKFV